MDRESSYAFLLLPGRFHSMVHKYGKPVEGRVTGS